MKITSAAPQKIHGIGLPKTGTGSLRVALKTLGLSVKYNNKDDWKLLSQGKKLSISEDATVHFGCQHYEMLSGRYILTVREPLEWLDSAKDWFTTHLAAKEQELVRLMIFGMIRFDPDHFLRIYSDHQKNFLDWAKTNEKEYLVFNVKDGWTPLCEFLNKPIPNEDFPHLNARKDRCK